ncbi:PREDICTED: piggyBac transposable element-derived protein 4-like [Habropoda laboriosa]|uniref:piggyBac transposable element-derived protein 4-like n=1 Tax=Habropoda laboriosa TaxID=597456 RepID=UPI00083D25BD|nr:PREDICTED: piggyBac transposable element-derived protein 4-like [Habropoda laboriosa]
MEYKNLKKRQLVNETDSESCDENESYINTAYRRKRRLNVPSISESEETDDVNVQSTNPSNITWTSKKFKPIIHDFTQQQSGIQTNISSSWEFLQYFQLFVSEELVEFIVEKTNNYWRQINPNDLTAGTDLDELYCFFAVSLLMTRNTKLSLDEYWSKNRLLRSDIFGEITSRDRYKLLLRMLHFADDHESNSDRLWRIREVINRLRRSFSDAFYPYQNLFIDESLLLYKGRLSFKQFIPSKRNRFGIKSFVLCDCKTGYVQDFIFYSGSGTISPQYADIGISGNIVMSLMEPYLHKGHTLYVDNWYTSPALFNCLHMNATNACGTVRKRRHGMSRIEKKLKEGEVIFLSSDNLLAMKWKDKKDVYMLSTMHTEEFVSMPKHSRKEEMVQKPSCVCDYNKFMGIVDKTDMVISTIGSMCKSMKWFKKYFFHMIDLCLWNACCLYKLKTGAPISMAQFYLKLIEQILTKYHKTRTRHSTNCGSNNELRLIGKHFPTPYTSSGKNKLRRCVVCSKNNKRRESRYQCDECDVGLCVYPCFKIYHTQTYY